jgi:hypothetical protein
MRIPAAAFSLSIAAAVSSALATSAQTGTLSVTPASGPVARGAYPAELEIVRINPARRQDLRMSQTFAICCRREPLLSAPIRKSPRAVTGLPLVGFFILAGAAVVVALAIAAIVIAELWRDSM